MPATSALGASTSVAGLILNVSQADSSPDTFNQVANVQDITLPLQATTVDVTNVGDTWRRRVATLLDMGKITFKVFWMMEETTHRNAVAGLRYIFVNRKLRNWQVTYPDGNSSTDAFAAYVTGFSITGKVGGVFEAMIELSNSGAPSLV